MLQSIIDCIVSIISGVITYYICKWLDRHDR